MKKTFYMVCICAFLLQVLSGCSSFKENKEIQNETSKSTTTSTSIIAYDEHDLDEDYSDEEAHKITFNKTSVEGEGVRVSGTTITITNAGTYICSGTLEDGNIIVDSSTDALIRIVLDGASITSSSTAPIYVKQADKVLLTLAKGTTNTLSDAKEYSGVVDNEPNATIFSKDDLTINGSGTLIVQAQYNNGIQSKDDLKIIHGTIQVTSQNHGLVGKDVLAIRDGTITIDAQGDGMKTTNAIDQDKGILCLEEGSVTIQAQQDGMQSENTLYIYGGNIKITSGNGSSNGTKMRNEAGFNPFEQNTNNETQDSVSMKGIKAISTITITGGNISINSADDALHANDSIIIEDGILNLESGDDGIHADQNVTIQKGTITISQSYEGIEGSDISINGGTIHLEASDDGINASASTSSTPSLSITGGYIYVEADGDGLDSNGNITMSDGTLIVNGTQSGGDGALDFDGTFAISGGTFIASGSSEMLQCPTDVSNGNLALITFTASQADMVHIQDSDGNAVITYQPTRSYQVLTIYTNKLISGSTYQIRTGGSSQNGKDGIYDDSLYTGGSVYQEFTIETTTTTIGNINTRGNTMGGGPGFR